MSVHNVRKPLILKRMLLRAQGAQGANPIHIPINSGFTNISSKLIKLSTIPLYREDIIFESKGETYLPGEYLSITILNKLNNLTNNCKTIARFVTRDEEIIEKTSDNLTQLIGQDAYNTLFHALCSVINQEYRIKAILSILTLDKESPLTETKPAPRLKIQSTETNDKSCQTNETRLELKKKTRRRMRKILVPYVVKPDEIKVKKVTVNPFTGTLLCGVSVNSDEVNFDVTENTANIIPVELLKTETVETEHVEPSIGSESERSILPDLGYLHDDNSNDSSRSYSTVNTFKTTTELMLNPTSLVNDVDRYTKEDQLVLPNHSIMLVDKTELRVPFKPEDHFHIATKENLLFLDEGNRKKLLMHQMQIDYKYCMNFIDGNLPIHLAVINDDVELLKRQCVVLKIRNQEVDILSDNGLTALKLSLFRESVYATNILLHHGADPFLADEEHSTCVHISAELKTEHLSIILHHCKLNARNIILQHGEELQTPGWEKKSDEELGKTVLHHLCTLFDKSGYTPLMLASKLGHYENVRLLTESVPSSVHLAMPTSGNTALFLAVAAACTAAADCGNKSKVVDHFRKTIEILLEAGADPSTDNNYSCNVNLLLQEFNCAELSMLVANKVTFTKFFNGDEDYTKNFDKYLLMKDGNIVSIKEIGSRKAKSVKNVVEDSKIVKLEVDNESVTEDACNKLVINEAGNKLITKETGDKLITKETGNKLITNKAGNSLVTKELNNKLITKELGKKLVTNEAGNSLGTKKLNNKLITKELGKKLVTKETGNKLVTKETGNKLITKETGNKPVITENILINKIITPCKIEKSNAKIAVESNINLKDFVIKPCNLKVDKVTKVIWYPTKRKAENLEDDAKRSKNT